MTGIDNFGEAPTSITEFKANRSQNPSDWTVRDMLVAALRDIDNGKLKTNAALFIFIDEEGHVNWHNAGVNRFLGTGMLEVCKHGLLERDRA